MSQNFYNIDAYLYKFKKKMDAYSEMKLKRFHRDILDFEQKRSYKENRTGDFILGLFLESNSQ